MSDVVAVLRFDWLAFLKELCGAYPTVTIGAPHYLAI